MFFEEINCKAHRQVTKAGDIIVTSDKHRTQTQNLQEAWDRLYDIVKNAMPLPILPKKTAIEKGKMMYHPLQSYPLTTGWNWKRPM
jgi:hypothetical protein